MSASDFNPSTAVYFPDESSAYALDAVKKAKEQEKIGARFPIEEMREYVPPILPGQLCAVIAQTSQYKSSFLHFWERDLAVQLMSEKRTAEGIIHVSTEECVEEQVYLDLAHEVCEDAGMIAGGKIQDWSRLEAAAVRIGKIPIYRIGDSLARAEDMPNLYLSNIQKSLDALIGGKIPGKKAVKPAAIFFDYLQAFPFDPEIKRAGASDAQRRLQVREDTFRLRQMGAQYKCPIIVAVQAKQTLDGARTGTMQPGIYDGEESSSIAQRSDRIITLWMPARTNPVNTMITIAETPVKVVENLLFVKVGKQRNGLPAGKTWECHIDFTRNTINAAQAPRGAR
jgi:replicative DNA helicase